jgi:hypothetical protein
MRKEGRLHVAVAESRRNGRQGHAVSQHMGSHGMPQQMERGPLGFSIPNRSNSFETVADTEFGLSGVPSGLQKIRSRSDR